MFRSFIKNYISGLLFGVFILVLSVIPISVSEKTSFLLFPGSDKLIHAGMYCIFTALLTNDYLRTNRRSAGEDSKGLYVINRNKLLFLLFSVFSYSLLIELIQHIAPYRSGEILDALANFFGILIGALLIYVWRKFKY